MATTGYTKNFVVKNGLTTGTITLDGLTGNISGGNASLTGGLSVTGISNLGAIANVYISGGTSGQAIVTDGAGNLSFANASASSSPAPMPTYVAVGDTLTISANYQGLFGYPITVDGTMTVDGVLIDVNDNGNSIATTVIAPVANVHITGGTSGYYLQTDGAGNLSWAAGGGGGGGSPGGVTTQVQFNDAGSFAGNAGFTFNKTTTTVTANNFIATSTANLGSASNVRITGGTSGYVLSTDGAGNLSWVAQSGGGGGGSGNVVIDNYTGNGVQTAFTLSATPTSENETIVNIDGVVQLHTSYTLSGNVLTLSSAPTNGSLIEISTLNLGGGSGGNGTPGGSTTQVQFNDAGSFAGNTGFTFNKTTGTLSVTYFSGAGNALSNIQGANVSGAVGLATYATTANAVAGANVSGQVSYAAVANSVAAANITGSISSATTAGTVTTAAQPNITSVGTLTSLTATGNIQGNYFIGNGSQLTGLSAGLSWSIASSNATMTANNGYFVDTSAGAKTMTLPASAVIGDTIRINDLAGTFGTNNLTVARNGGNIQGVAQDLVVSVNQSSFGLVYSNSTYGWKLLEI